MNSPAISFPANRTTMQRLCHRKGRNVRESAPSLRGPSGPWQSEQSAVAFRRISRLCKEPSTSPVIASECNERGNLNKRCGIPKNPIFVRRVLFPAGPEQKQALAFSTGSQKHEEPENCAEMFGGENKLTYFCKLSADAVERPRTGAEASSAAGWK